MGACVRTSKPVEEDEEEKKENIEVKRDLNEVKKALISCLICLPQARKIGIFSH